MLSIDDSAICRSILESLPTGVCVLDMRKMIVLWSDGAEKITGHLRHEVIGHSCVAEPLLHCDQPGCEFCNEDCAGAQAMRTAQGAESVGFLRHKLGHEVPVRIHAVPIHNQHGSIVGAVETFVELQQAYGADGAESVCQLPDCIDPITGVSNRAVLQAHLQRALLSREEANLPFGILLLRVEDLSHFRSSLGSEAASSLLRVIARTLESTLWTTDFVGRWSDDQFVLLLTGCSEDRLPAVRERVRRALAGESIEWWGERHSLPISIGQATAVPGDNSALLIARAQESLRAASASLNSAAQSPGS